MILGKVPSLGGDGTAVFIAAVEDVHPKDFSEYERRWRKMYHEGLSEDTHPPVDRLRSSSSSCGPQSSRPEKSNGLEPLLLWMTSHQRSGRFG